MPMIVANAMETEVYPTASWFPPESCCDVLVLDDCSYMNLVIRARWSFATLGTTYSVLAPNQRSFWMLVSSENDDVFYPNARKKPWMDHAEQKLCTWNRRQLSCEKVRIERMVSELQVCVRYVSHVCKYVTIYIMTQCSLVPSCHSVQ